MAIRSAELMQDVASRHDGGAVMIGDAARVDFHEPFGCDLRRIGVCGGIEPRGLPPVQVRVNAGPMTYTDDDYYGLVVNIAARIAAMAGPGQVLVGEIAAAAGDPERVRFDEDGPAQLKRVTR